ncbi:hypothetical protein M413DRAFT_438943 [Hebeloma cylindrosporum]|uniref:Uncharacterized protein n=1 Tax=Hebeloma cylindrosporum TaxID=76867 RepID=A0A0C3D071_HEBCY|nr:hypothetical protein M413DRAFT_438943 [Hebeloma cylindrosporum h7]
MTDLYPIRLKPIGSQSVFTSIRGQHSLEFQNSNSRWHPKITVYRLLVISTTISLGSAKAAATFNGKSYVSITIEWISGVAVFCSLFMVGWFEGDSSHYPKLAWLFESDLIRLTWRAFKKTGPNYTSEEQQRTVSLDGEYPPITGYRLLVSGSVFIFGMVKAYLSYIGLGGAANALDWTFGVLVTSGLYVLGLYENNSANKMPYFFETHYGSEIYSGGWFISRIAMYLTGLALAIGFSWCWHQGLQLLHESNQTDFLEIYDGTKQDGPPTFLAEVHNMSMRCMMDGMAYLGILVGVGGSLHFLREIVSAFAQLSVVRKVAKSLRQAVLCISEPISRKFDESAFETPIWVKETVRLITKSYLFLKRFGVHILLFAIATVVCAVLAFYFLGFPFRIFHKTESQAEFNSMLFFGIGYTFFSVGLGGAACYGLLHSVRQLLQPFLEDLDVPYGERIML